jgi:hypothetical protein
VTRLPSQGQGHGGPAKGAGRGGAARGSRPPFEDGNLASVTHGAFSDRLVNADAEGYKAALYREAPWLERDEFRGAVNAWAKAEVRARRFGDHSEDVLLGADGNESGASVATGRWMDRARRLREDLGLTPASYARIQRDLSAAGLTIAAQIAAERRKAVT